tara:strand:+ start:279 stop:1649 length:1371 start_codon:yes stop_codon:yes gene_type:complete
MDEESFLDRIDRLLSPETPAEMGATFAAESTPYLGTGMDVGNFLMGLRNRDAVRTGAGALAALLPFVGAGTLRKVGGAVSDRLSKPKVKIKGVGRHSKQLRSEPYSQPEMLSVYTDHPERATDFLVGASAHPQGYDPRYARVVEDLKTPLDQLDLFPTVDLNVDVGLNAPVRNMLGRSGIKSLGRAVIEDAEKAMPGRRVGHLFGERVTGSHADDLEEHIMRLPRSFFFKKPKASRMTDMRMRMALDPPPRSPQINISQRDLFLSGARQATDDELLEFHKIAPIQRANPEKAMLRAQRLVSGVMSPVVEHTGDLTHRLTDHLGRAVGAGKGAGYSRPTFLRIMHGDVAPKLDHMLRRLNDPYGFEREFAENLASNARSVGIPLDQYKKQAYAALQEYADEHKKIPVFNELQKLSRDAAIAVGERNFNKARRLLERLKEISDNEELFLRKITEIGFD